MNFSSRFTFGHRGFISASLVSLVTLVFGITQPLQSQSLIKINLKPRTVTFIGPNGDGGSPCEGIGMCRGGSMLRENESPSSYSHIDKPITAEGRFTLQDGKIYFILTHVKSSNGANLTNITSFPFDTETELPRDIARGFGFASVRIVKGRYPASMESVFPVQAKFSTGLNAASIAAPRGERHASISFEALRQMNVTVLVFDTKGKKVATLMENATVEGSETPQTIAWNGKNDAGKSVASGEYRVEVRCVLTDSGASFAETVPFILAPVAIAH